MFETSIAGSLPKPAWLAETNKLWPQWKAEGDALVQAKADATLLWIKAQEDAGLDIVCDGEQSRQHFVHGFLEQVEGIDFENKVKMGIRDNRYDALVPQVVSALRLKGRVTAFSIEVHLNRNDLQRNRVAIACGVVPMRQCIEVIVDHLQGVA
jgi:5-methyltetrahydropteroyltriglutamate--homocysteine methyltransferase